MELHKLHTLNYKYNMAKNKLAVVACLYEDLGVFCREGVMVCLDEGVL